MDELNAGENLYQLWMLYACKNDLDLFKDYLDTFLETYKELIDTEFTQLTEGGFTEEGPHHTKLPEGLLQVIQKCLAQSSEKCTTDFDMDTFIYTENLLKCLIVICRNLDNIALVASCEFVSQIVAIASIALNKLCVDEEEKDEEEKENAEYYTSFVSYALHYLECMYDPYMVWRKRLMGWKVDKSRLKIKPALLHVEVVPFFYECFQHANLKADIQMRLFHLFGAIISGAQVNALKAICPATLDVLLKVLSRDEITGPTNEQRQEFLGLKEMVLKCLVRMVHVIHCCSPDQRQVEVGAVLEGYFQVLLKVGMNLENEHNGQLQLKMLTSISEMLVCRDKSALQVIFVASGTFDTFVTFLQRTPLTGINAQRLAMSVISVMNSTMTGSGMAKEKFKDKGGYQKFVEALKSLGQPSQELLQTVLDQVVEGRFGDADSRNVNNVHAALMLVQWLPDIQSHDLQVWLSESLKTLCGNGTHNRINCCNEGMISAILNILQREKQINPIAVGHLISLLESLGTLSITASELKQLVSLLQLDEEEQQMPYCGRLMHAMSIMARRDGREGALHYFDINQHDAGITLPGVRKWPGQGFTFHAWVSLHHQPKGPGVEADFHRRQLYSIMTSAGHGFEAFFTLDSILVVSASVKKEFFTVSVTDFPLTPHHWHCIDISHSCGKGPFSQSQLCVYIDGHLRATAQLKFPPLAEPFMNCRIGSPGVKITSSDQSQQLFQQLTESKMKFPLMNLKLPFQGQNKAQTDITVNSIAMGTQDETWGSPVSLQGHLGYVCIFHEAIQLGQVQSLHNLGGNKQNLFQVEENGVAELANKLVLHYNAKACKSNLCLDLSGNQHHGRLVGNKCVTWDIKDAINCIGGVQVLFPLLEQINKAPEGQLIDLGEGSAVSTSPPVVSVEEQDDWVVVPSSSYADAKLEQNQVAGFLTLVRNMIATSLINQESLVRCNGVAIVGALLQKVNPALIDVHVLMAIQLMVEAVGESNKHLLHSVYQYLLFDFRVWSRSEFPVRIGLIQYLSTIIKDDRKYFRKRYGVQYLLDVIKTYYSVPDVKLTEEDCRTIRVSLLGLIKFYVVKEISFEELQSIMGFIASVKEEKLLCESLDLLVNLLENPSSSDQVYLLMFEPGMAEHLYSLLTVTEHCNTLKEKVLKLVQLLLKSDKVYEKSKVRLRLQEVGFSGLISLMGEQEISESMATSLMDIVFSTDGSQSYDGALAIIQLVRNANLDIKHLISQKLLDILLDKPQAAKMFSRQLGWQEAIVKLLVVGPSKRKNSNDPWKRPVMNATANRNSDPDLGASGGIYTIDMGSAVEPIDFSKIQTPSWNQSEAVDIPHINPSQSQTSLASSLAMSPLYTKMSFFDDLSQFDVDYLEGKSSSLSMSRSSSASVEDLTQNPRHKHDNLSIATSPVGGAAALPREDSNGQVNQSSGVKVERPGSDANQEKIYAALREMGMDIIVEQNLERKDELCQNILIALFTIMWKGVEGSDNAAWKERGVVFSCLHHVSEHNTLLKSGNALERQLYEMMVTACISDLKEAGQASAYLSENAMELMKLVYHFILCDIHSNEDRFSERLLEDVCAVMDLLAVWERESGWAEMAQIGMCIMLAYAAHPELDLCSVAAARLHTLLQTRSVDRLTEACYLFGSIDRILLHSLEAHNDHYSFLMPVMKALVEKCYDLLNMKTYLPNLPNTSMSPSFYDTFKLYCKSDEWRSFVDKQVKPSMEQFISVSFDAVRTNIKTFWAECHEDMMINGHKRNREKGESKLRCQSQIIEPFNARGQQEERQFQNMATQQHNQHNSALRQWRATKRFFTGERGAWADRQIAKMNWKLSNTENFSRMRPKLIPNYNFDLHREASQLRDNTGMADMSLLFLPEVPKEVLVSNSDIGDDRLGDEEWSVISSASAINEEGNGKEKLILQEECELVTLMDKIRGRLEVTTTHVYFFDCKPDKEEGGEDFKWALSQLREIHFRRYNLRRSALELFLIDQSNYFLNFQKKIRNKVYSRILSLRPPNLIYYGSRSPAELLKSSQLTQKWVQREISNFEYLMQLNTIAGRTYNDLSQYPVFPWVLCDYTSEELNIEDPKIYRDLSKPIGVVNEKNEKEVREKFDSFEDPSGIVEKFHYGTHYSNAPGVMHYLLRMEPFTTLHIQLQSGKFDVTDRQFYSVPSTWQSMMDNPNDVKELTPEFFYLPEFLENQNGFELGSLQGSKKKVNNVDLPPWASSPEDFIYKHRKALESEYVSSHLHDWIDLIFGYKQKGEAAVEALNVFYYCTYEGAVDLDAISNPVERKAVEGMINNFGQTPCQLLKEPHPRRMSMDDAHNRASKSDKPLSFLNYLNSLKAYYVEASSDNDPVMFITVPRNQSRSFINQGMPVSMVTVTEDGVVGCHGWLPYDKSISNYFTFEKDLSLNNPRSRRCLAGPFAPGLQITPNLFAVSHDAKLVFSGGHWDNSLRAYNVAKNKVVCNIIRHTDIVTCLALDYCGSHLMTGSKDTTCMIWQITYQSGMSHSVQNKPVQILYGHDDEISCVALSIELDMAVSGAKDGTVIIHTVRKGYYMRTLRPPSETGWDLHIPFLSISDTGQIALYCKQAIFGRPTIEGDKLSLHLYSINGKHLASERVSHPISHMIVTDEHVILGNTQGYLILKELFGLRTLTTMPLHVPIQCVAVTHSNSHILVGLKDGKLIIVGIKKMSEVK